jgi:hypothetical protein
MNVVVPRAYIVDAESATPWWVTIAGGIAGKPKPSPTRRDRLEALVAGRRAAATARMKATRARSERAIARLIRETAA